MCISSAEAELLSTIIGVWDIDHPEYGYRHVLAYQNAPRNLAEGPNSMILAIPTNQAIKPEQILDTENDKTFLVEMAKLVAPLKVFSRSQIRSNTVTEMGIYHIAILNDLSFPSVQACLSQIPEEKRPEIASELITFYQETYPGFPLLICCFNNEHAEEASPIMVHFDPAYPDTFMYNTVEAHGHVPELGEPVLFHQRIIIGSYKIKEAFGDYQAFDHSTVSPALQPFLPQFGQGDHVTVDLPNFDIIVDNTTLGESDTINMDVGIISESFDN